VYPLSGHKCEPYRDNKRKVRNNMFEKTMLNDVFRIKLLALLQQHQFKVTTHICYKIFLLPRCSDSCNAKVYKFVTERLTRWPAPSYSAPTAAGCTHNAWSAICWLATELSGCPTSLM
jgi:hypothetical protein